MAKTQKTREQLVQELEKARAQIAQLQRANAEESLGDNEEKYRLFVDNAFEGIVLLDTKGKITDINPCAAEIAGLERGELIGKHVVQLVPLIKFDLKRALSLLKSAIRGESPSVSEMAITNRAGKQHIIEGILNPIRKANRIIGVSLIVKDITAYKRMTELLTNQRDLSASLGAITDLTAALDCLLETALKLESIDCGGVYLVDEHNGEIKLAAHRGLSLAFVESAAHYAADSAHARIVMAGELLHRPYSELIPGVKDERQEREKLQAIVSVPVLHGGRVVATMNLASHVHVEIPSYELDALQAIAAQVGGVIARLKAEAQMIAALEALRDSEGKFRNIVESSPLGIHMYELQAEQRLVFAGANPAADTILGVDNATFIGKTIEEAFPPLADTQVPARYRQAAAQGTPWRTEQIEYDEGGIKGAFEVIAFQTTPGEMAAMFHDVSERVRTAEALRQSEALLNATQRLTKVGGWEWDVENQTIFWTEETYRIHDLLPGEMEPGSIKHIERSMECYDPQDRPVIAEAFQKCVEKGQAYDLEFPFSTAQGRRIWIRTTARPVLDDSKGGARRVVKVIGNIMDITERKRTEEALRESEERYRSFVQNFQGIAFHGRMDFTPIFFHGAAEEITGYTEREFLDGKPRWDQVIHPEDLPALFTEDEERLRSIPHYSYEREYRIVRKDGAVRWVHEVIQNVCDDSGKPAILQGAIYDITERKRAEEALRESEQFLQNVFDGIQDGISVLDVDLNVIRVNAWMEKMYTSQAPLQGKKCYSAYQRRESPCTWCPSLPALKTGKAHNETVPYPSKENPTGWIDLSAFPLKDAAGHIVGVIEHVKDITWRVQAERELVRLSSAMRMSKDSVVLSDLEGKITDVNATTLRMYGTADRQDLIGRDSFELIVPEEREHALADMMELLKTGHLEDQEYHTVTKSGGIVPVEVGVAIVKDAEGEPIGFVSISRDITERVRVDEELKCYRDHLEELVRERTQELEQAQAELVRKERLSALGQLTATVAHEIRNPLGTVRTCVFAISDAIKQDETFVSLPFDKLRMPSRTMDRVGNALQIAERNIVRCDNIISELLDYSRDRELQLQSTPVDTWLEALLDEQAIPQDIVCVRELTFGVKVPLDREHLRRAVVNVVENAVQAMQEQARPGQRLTVCTRIAGAGSRLEIEVRDTGPGIPDDVLPRIFEPLFSTKSYGVGLGLSVVKNVMEQHGGGVSVQSQAADDEQPGGTSVILWLPVDF